MNKCTCGTQGNGICSDWCDSLRPDLTKIIDPALYVAQERATRPVIAGPFEVTGELEAFFPLPSFVDPATFRIGESFKSMQMQGDDDTILFYRVYQDGVMLVVAEMKQEGCGSLRFEANQTEPQ
jgi:hypothetical protein